MLGASQQEHRDQPKFMVVHHQKDDMDRAAKEGQAGSDRDTEAEAEAKAEARAKAKAAAKAGAQAEAHAAVKPKANAEARANGTAGSTAGAKSESDAAVKPKAKADARANGTGGAKAGATAEAHAAVKANAKAEPALPCVGPGQDCRSSRCCSLQGMQCYAKDAYWAACQATCSKEGGWACKEIGERSPQRTAATWAGEDCSLTHLCANSGLQCFRKDAQCAYCSAQAPPDWDGTILGGSRWEYAVQPVPLGDDAQVASGASLFCFMAVLPGSQEVQLAQRARDLEASIFSDACNANAVFDCTPSIFVHEGTWNSFQNTEAFVKVWEHVRDEGSYLKYEWTVKVDPDCVFMPYRLQYHLQALRAPAGKPIYVKNVDISFGFLGAIEIVSRVALMNYFDSYQDCHRTMGDHSGEDGFLKGCLDAVGAGYMTDASILRNPHDGDCGDSSRVAFHPHKDPGDWAACYYSASR